MNFSFKATFFGISVLFIISSLVLQQGFITAALVGSLGGILFFVANRFLLLPLEKLRVSLKKIQEESFGVRLSNGSGKEARETFEAFNDMAFRLEETRQRTGLVNRMKSEFLSIVAHQLRTPLSALKWVMYMLLHGDMGELRKEQKETLEKGNEANERMITLVNDFLDVVRIEEGRFNYDFTEKSILEVVESAVNEVKILAEQRGAELFLHEPLYILPDVFLDVMKLRLGLMNILENAIQYTRAKGKIDVELTMQDNEIIVSVKDTGIGIVKEDLDRIFTKFFRGKNAMHVQPDGSGLGLFITKNIVEKHGGRIWIESEEKKGTAVFFTLPVE